MTAHQNRSVVGLACFTAATGLVDATSYLGLGHVFTANMTGNIVFLGFALGGAAGFSVKSSLVALAGFLIGALVAGRMVPSHPSPTQTRTPFALQALVLAAAVVLAAVFGRHAGEPARLALLALLGGAMGLQNAAVRRLGVADMTTTVLTMTLTGIAADSRFARGTDPNLVRRVGSVVLMLAGAAVGAAIQPHGIAWPVLLAFAGVATGGYILVSGPPAETEGDRAT